jgi:hypothetical protein
VCSPPYFDSHIKIFFLSFQTVLFFRTVACVSKQFYSFQQLHVFVSEQKFTRTRMIEMTCTKKKKKKKKKTDRLMPYNN